jgi:SAM-dependent methyltransferase
MKDTFREYFRRAARFMIPERYYPGLKRLYFNTLYYGDRCECPCCGRRCRRFKPFEGVKGSEPQCPNCDCLGRHRLLFMYFKDRTNLFTDRLEVLQFAPAPVLQETFISLPNLDYVSADLEDPNALLEMDITDIGFEDDRFDVILCSHVLEHVTDDRKAMGELFRVLKPGGWAVLQSPVDPGLEHTYEAPEDMSSEERKMVLGRSDHVRTYGRDYVNRLREAGFIVEEDRFIDEFSGEETERYGLGREEVIYLCTKPLEG